MKITQQKENHIFSIYQSKTKLKSYQRKRASALKKRNYKKFNFTKQNIISGLTNAPLNALNKYEAQRIKRLLLKSIAKSEKEESKSIP